MKKILIFIICCSLFIFPIPVHATENAPNTISLENGLTYIDKITVEPSATRSSPSTHTLTRSFYDGETLIATIAFTATFQYDGSSVSVISKSVTQTDTYRGWSYKQESFTSSGGTVTLSGKLNYLLLFNSTSFTMSMTCDANGNISY